MKRWILALAAVMLTTQARAQAQMTIATGVDPAFSQFYVAQQAGIFVKNGLEVSINTGPSGSAMIPFLINDQVNAVFGSDLAGVINHNVSPDIVPVADGTLLLRWESVVARNIADLAGLKGKKIGIAKGTGAELFWAGVVKKYNLNPADYTILDIDAPEMVAALERGDLDGFVVWEPWATRAVMSVQGAKVLNNDDDIVHNRNFVYMNRSWIEKHRDTAERFMRSLCEANDLINADRPAAAKMVAKFLSMPPALASELMPKLLYTMDWTDASLDTIKNSEDLLIQRGKMKAPLDYAGYVYTDLLKAVRPEAVRLSPP